MDRHAILRSWLDRDGLGLEIGPLHAPVAPKRDGWRVETVDHGDAETLRARYRDSPDVDTALIEDVDHVSDGRSLVEVIGGAARYDWILASHVAEHVPDLLGFLKDCETLLKPGGRLVVALPDKRRCMDALRPLSTTGDVLQAHAEGRRRHQPARAFDCISRAMQLGGLYGWGAGHGGEVTLQYGPELARAAFDTFLAADDYQDIHGWVFAPPSFRLIVEELNRIGLCALREEGFHDTVGIEFFAALSRRGTGPAVEHRDLVLDAARAEMDGTAALLGITGDEAVEPALAATRAQIAALQATVAGLQAQAAALQSANAALKVENAALTAAAADQAGALAEARARVAAVHASSSWRVTAPLRWGSGLLRGQSGG